MTSAPDRIRKSERRAQILMELRWKPHVRVAELAEQFGVSTETIRRDLHVMNEARELDRAHGGASARMPGSQPSLDERQTSQIEERERIARFATSRIADGASLMIDAGASTIALARCLAVAGLKLKVVTNSLPVAMILGPVPNIYLRLCPGDMLAPEAAVTGPDTTAYIARHNVDCCLLGASAASEQGISEAIPGFSEVKRAMMAQAMRTVFLIDHSKLGRNDLDHVAGPAPGRTIYTDCSPDSGFVNAWQAGGGELQVVEA